MNLFFIRNLTLLICFSCLVMTSIKAQSNYLPGYIIGNNGTADSGLINYQQWNSNPTKISFKSTKNSNVITYTLKEIKAFEVSGRDRYEKAVVKIDMRPVNVDEMDLNQQDTSRTETVFLRTLVKGTPFCLYEYFDTKVHYYFSRDGGSIEELEYKVSFQTRKSTAQGMSDNVVTATDNKYVVTNNGFKQQLLKLLDGTLNTKQIDKLLEAEYKESDLRPFFSSINSNVNYAFKPLKKKSLRFSAGAGLAIQTVKFKENNELKYEELVFPTKVSPFISLGVDHLIGRDLNLGFIRLGVLYNTLSNKGEYFDPNPAATYGYEISQTIIQSYLSFNYNILKRDNLKWYFGASYGLNISNYKKNKYLFESTVLVIPYNGEQTLNLNKTWSAVYAQTGIKIKDNIELNCIFKVDGNYVRTPSVREKGQQLFFGVNYHF